MSHETCQELLKLKKKKKKIDPTKLRNRAQTSKVAKDEWGGGGVEEKKNASWLVAEDTLSISLLCTGVDYFRRG